ncbi:ectoine synthase [Chrysiogenes arsenatis]|uniref:ectoine synthase n=1 Tax=Chrysiogenes arsenatis TaxID=309797 RepID=UPI0004059BCC|nr:ectoine synthase [Chrysiogenes arsenatis]
MLIRRLEGAEGNERDVIAENGQWRSQRLLLKDDQMGFSFHITTIYAGKDNFFHYKNHLESVYCISGEGEIEELDNGTVHQIRPGTVYALDKHDRHRLRAFSEMTMACVFNPPVSGREVHGPDGAYPADVD